MSGLALSPTVDPPSRDELRPEHLAVLLERLKRLEPVEVRHARCVELEQLIVAECHGAERTPSRGRLSPHREPLVVPLLSPQDIRSLP